MRVISTYRHLGIVLLILMVFSCSINEVTDPNNPSLNTVLTDASTTELQALVTGLEARSRDFWGGTTSMFGSFGREVWAYFGSDPRYLSHWLGIGVTDTYSDFFASEDSYVFPYLAVKQANILEQAALNSSLLTDEQTAGYLGFAKTIKAFQLLVPLMQQYENGVRINVSDPLNPGPILGYSTVLQAIRSLLNEALNDLRSSGSTFLFDLSSGFENYQDPVSFEKVNRALAARCALYAESWQDALNALNGSFLDLQVNPGSIDKLYTGPSFIFGEAPDINNPLFYPYDQATNTILIVHPALLEDALPGDKRIQLKFARRNINPASTPNLVDVHGNRLLGEYQDNRWATNITPISFIRNEELILIYAEVQARLGELEEAVKAINIIRSAWELDDYSGTISLDELIEEILLQRRYSLWAEGGHRWIDLRRTNRLNSNYIDLRDGGTIFTQVSRRSSEINWDNR